MHLLPQLREVERHFGEDLIIIGVHAGKYHAERRTENIRQAALRLSVTHPVINDRQFRVWRAFAVNAWPTLVFIDPLGGYVGARAGEAQSADLIRIIGGLLADSGEQGLAQRGDLPLQPARELETRRPLSFPGKVLVTNDDRIFVSDSGHHRICAIRLDPSGVSGVLEAIAGSSEAGFADGDLTTAAFRSPQGLAHSGGMTYVADTGNHAIRRIDWAEGTVTTIAGTGRQATHSRQAGAGLQVALSSPWDVLHHDGELYIAMAGAHQLWRLDLMTGYIDLHAGAGGEALQDGLLLDALLAQPSSLASDGESLFFADSEASAIRRASYDERGRIETLAGTGLFDFGDVDGTGDRVRLQHPQGVAWHRGKLYIADTYNDKIKVLDPDTRTVTSLLLLEAHPEDAEASGSTFFEPGGLSAYRGKLYVADTNHHAIRVIDLSTLRVSTLHVRAQ